MNEKETIVGMPPGIGDLHWIMAKFESFKEKHNIKKVKVVMNLGRPENECYHDCSLEYLNLVPFVDSAESILDIIPFEYALNKGSGKSLFKNHGGCDYMIEFNSKLEAGIKLKDILPEYEMNWNYPIDEPPVATEFAKNIKRIVGGKLILLYTSSIEGNNIWVKDLWTPKDWMELAQRIYNKTGCSPIFIGARWDTSYIQKVLELDKHKIICDLGGRTPVVQLFALLREADVLVAFQCGVLMMGIHFKTPAVGFWPIINGTNPQGQFKRNFMRSWLPPWAEEVGFMPYGWGDKEATPDGIFAAIRRYL